MFRRVNKERVCCPVVFYEEIIVVSKLKNFSNWHRNRPKTQNFQTFKVFKQFLSNIWQTLWIWMLKSGNQERICSPLGFSEELSDVFKWKISHIGTENDKKPKFFQFSKIYAIIVLKFQQSSSIGMLKTVTKVWICGPVLFYEDIIAVFKMKKSQIFTEIDKKPKIFKLPMFLCSFCQT